jgi:hypothetical protein
MGDPRADTPNIEVKWAEMETRSMAQAADAAVKLTTGADPVITPQTAQEKYLGMTQTERDRDDAWRAERRASEPAPPAPTTIVMSPRGFDQADGMTADHMAADGVDPSAN